MMRCIGISDQSDKFEYVMQLPLQVLPLLAADSTYHQGHYTGNSVVKSSLIAGTY